MNTSPAHFLNMLKFSTGLDALSLTQFGGGDSFDKFSVILSGRRLASLTRAPVRISPTSGRRVVNNPYQSRTMSDRAILRRRALRNEPPSFFDTPEMNAARQVEQGKRLFGLDLDLFPSSPSRKAVLATTDFDSWGRSIPTKYYYKDINQMQPMHMPSRPDGRLPMVEAGIANKSLLGRMEDRDLHALPTVEHPLFSRRPDLQDRVDKYVRAAGRRVSVDDAPNPLGRPRAPHERGGVPDDAEFPYVRTPLSPQDAVDRLSDAVWSFGSRIR